MKNLLQVLMVLGFLFAFYQLSQAQPANNDCSSASNLAAGTSCSTNGTTDNATVQSGSFSDPTSCNSSWNQTVWYKFTPSTTSQDIQVTVTSINGATWCPSSCGMAVFDAGTGGGSCSNISNSSMVSGSCVNINTVGNGDMVMIDYLTGLDVTHTYYIQVGYASSGPCKTPNFCIYRFATTSAKLHNCGSCSSACGSSCAFSSQPSTVAQVTSGCPQFNVVPANEGGTTSTQCWTFTAAGTSCGFQEIINSTCGSGNVTSLSWTLQKSSCGPNVATGDINNMTTFNNYVFTIGQSYTYCMTFTVPTTCYHSSYYPYVWGAVVLPIELTNFTASPDKNVVDLRWETESELNNDFFSLQHSTDGLNFNEIARIPGSGTSTHSIEYKYTDQFASPGINYYRLVQNDLDGTIHYSQVVTAMLTSLTPVVTLSPNPAVDNGNNLLNVISNGDEDATIAVFNAVGQLVYSQEVNLHIGRNEFDMNMSSYSTGIYNLIVFTHSGNKGVTFIK
jgi:hypothetical protein